MGNMKGKLYFMPVREFGTKVRVSTRGLISFLVLISSFHIMEVT
jgi:hypothetical protein